MIPGKMQDSPDGESLFDHVRWVFRDGLEGEKAIDFCNSGEDEVTDRAGKFSESTLGKCPRIRHSPGDVCGAGGCHGHGQPKSAKTWGTEVIHQKKSWSFCWQISGAFRLNFDVGGFEYLGGIFPKVPLLQKNQCWDDSD